MAESCEHPFCTRLISNKCSNHCQLDLCDEHLIEHKNLFLVQYEKSFNLLKKSFNELIHSIDETKKTIHTEYKKNISIIQETSTNKSNEIEQKTSFILTAQNLIKKKLQLLTDVKNGQALLYQYDIEQIKLYLTKIREYQSNETEILSLPSSSSSSSSPSSSSSAANSISEDDDDNDNDEDYYHKSKANTKCNAIMNFYGPCPLTRLGIYGLQEKHNLHLCSEENNQSDYHLMTHFYDYHLMTHFYNYHHIKWSLSHQLISAIMTKSNPLKTCIFKPTMNIIDQRFNAMKCPLDEMNLSKCKKRCVRNSLKQHLTNIHHLSSETSNKILETLQNQGHLTRLDFNENDFNQKD